MKEAKTHHESMLRGTNRGKTKVPMRSAGDTGDYGKDKGEARIAPSFPADVNMEKANEGGYHR